MKTINTLQEKLPVSILSLLLLMPVTVSASGGDMTVQDNSVAVEPVLKTAKSPKNRVALLELYTSEGCSSCPPADRFVSNLKRAGITSKQLIPLAFHVTYWDYIGWKDKYADKRHDSRQRDQAHKNKQRTVYTPQFLLAGDDYRSYSSFSEDVNKLVAQAATVDLVLTSQAADDSVHLTLSSDIEDSQVKDVGLYLVMIENNLKSQVDDGENEGELLHHDYVVRTIQGPFFHSKPDHVQQKELTIKLNDEWKKDDLMIVAFAENPHTGEVLQAVRLRY